MRFFCSLLNACFDMLDPDIPKRLPQHPVASALGIDPTGEVIATVIMQWQTRKQWDRTAYPRNCYNSDFNKTGPSCWSSTDSPPSTGARGKSHSSGKTRSLPYSTRRATRRSAGTTAASRSCYTRIKCSLKSLTGDSAITVR